MSNNIISQKKKLAETVGSINPKRTEADGWIYFLPDWHFRFRFIKIKTTEFNLLLRSNLGGSFINLPIFFGVLSKIEKIKQKIKT